MAKSGALALSFAALENLLSRISRDWTLRYGQGPGSRWPTRSGVVLMESLRPFVYRRLTWISALFDLCAV